MNSTLRDHPARAEEIRPEDVGAEIQSTKFKILGLKDVLELSPPDRLVKGLLTRGESSCLYGASEFGKTFVAISISLSVSSGRDWFGHCVQRGPVVYVAAEGLWGIRARVLAWIGDDLEALFSGLEKNFFVLGQAVNLREPADVQELIQAIEHLGTVPSLVVLDTLARSMVGGDENSAKDMGALVAGCDSLRDHFGATVLLVHHTGKVGDAERGSSALRGAMDSMLSVKREGDNIRLSGEKQKDGLRFPGLTFHLDEIQVGAWPDGDPMTSCRLRLADDGDNEGQSQGALRQTERALLETMRDNFDDSGACKSELKDTYPKARSSFYKALRNCCERGYVEIADAGGVTRYHLTEAGRQILVSGVSACLSERPETELPSSHSPPPPIGGGVETEAETSPRSPNLRGGRGAPEQADLPGYGRIDADQQDDGGRP